MRNCVKGFSIRMVESQWRLVSSNNMETNEEEGPSVKDSSTEVNVLEEVNVVMVLEYL